MLSQRPRHKGSRTNKKTIRRSGKDKTPAAGFLVKIGHFRKRKDRIMANLSFDFNKFKRTFFNVTLKDGTTLQVKMPTKNTFGKVQALRTLQDDDGADVADVIDTMAGVMADCLNNNLNGVKVDQEMIAEEYDIEEMTAFIGEYYEKFVGTIQNNPN